MNNEVWPSPLMEIKLNIDGSLDNSSKRGAVGGVFRNTEENWFLGFSAHINVNSAFEAEILALVMGLNLAIKMKVTQLAIATDFKKLAMTLNEYGITERDTDEINLISIYRDLVEQMRNPPVHHEKWSMNVIADMLAKEGNKLKSDCFWKE
ncbi:uncharacterized protein LOC124898438 [Capsicum annuum]|uniref:uncharacterized protein LOC124898438 n=1 Tax=Capsicum annuum TaxID=4072 RepID=UPI001FB18123|nr:uncharacterized protein LOC124898438 [Capsicum annuum]